MTHYRGSWRASNSHSPTMCIFQPSLCSYSFLFFLFTLHNACQKGTMVQHNQSLCSPCLKALLQVVSALVHFALAINSKQNMADAIWHRWSSQFIAHVSKFTNCLPKQTVWEMVRIVQTRKVWTLLCFSRYFNTLHHGATKCHSPVTWTIGCVLYIAGHSSTPVIIKPSGI